VCKGKVACLICKDSISDFKECNIKQIAMRITMKNIMHSKVRLQSRRLESAESSLGLAEYI
jgi:hypothetical protein